MIVVGSPSVDFVPGIGQAQQPVLIEAPIPELAVEALDKGILCRLARLNEGQCDLSITRPEELRFVGQLGHRHTAFMGLEDGDDLLFAMAGTFHRKISCYQGKRSGNLTLPVDQFLGERSDNDMKRLEVWAPILHSSLVLHYRLALAAHCSGATQDDGPLEDAFLDILPGRLTETQRLVARAILQGHSNGAIATQLNISEGTVRIHKHNIYQKLAITSHSDLFRLFIDYLSCPR